MHVAPPPHFDSEYQQELAHWLRRRFTILCLIYLALLAVGIGSTLLVLMLEPENGDRPSTAVSIALLIKGLLTIAVVASYFRSTRKAVGRDETLRAASGMILAIGLISIATRIVMHQWLDRFDGDFLISMFGWHLGACLLLPWQPRESLRPMIPLLAVWDVYLVFFVLSLDPTWVLLTIIFGPGLLVPGVVICDLRLRRHGSRFRARMVGKHFITMQQEYARARSIHDSIFPEPFESNCVQFEYVYAPMRELGGDFVHVRQSANGLVHLTLVDVTGHGLPAALTVNRLYGEIERILAEDDNTSPSELIAALNRYIHLTLAHHNVFATGICMRLDPYVGELRWASAGHPPAFLRGANGVVTELGATNCMLGAVPRDAFEKIEEKIDLSPGDVVIAYTDGVYEVRDSLGKVFGMDRVREMMRRQPPPRNWPQFISSAVSKHSAGRPADDVLIASLTFVNHRLQSISGPAVSSSEQAQSSP